MTQIVNDELVKLMGGEVSELVFTKSGPTVILLAGLQGVGKTTVGAKLALYLKKQVLVHSSIFLYPILVLKFVMQYILASPYSSYDCINYRGRIAC